MSANIFIDGAAGTTGLQIRERLAGRADVALLSLPDSARKDETARKDALNAADIVILCLPDPAAREAVALIDNPKTRVIDASSAHRVAPGWTYGFAEALPGQYDKIASARFVSNPGCWPTGFLALVAPLVRAGRIPASHPLSVHGVSGYSGGGKAMIAEFEDETAPGHTDTMWRGYGLSQHHKHVPEMRMHAGLEHAPLFSPSVVRLYSGMIVEVPLHLATLPGRVTLADIHAVLAETYAGRPLVSVAPLAQTADMTRIEAETSMRSDRMRLHVFGGDDVRQARLVAALDNLGKGASGAAVQNLNIMLGLPETTGLL